jgi:hypothetical protein
MALLMNRFDSEIREINAALKAFAHTRRLMYVDCSRVFVANGSVDQRLMPDLLHPNHEGMRALGRCFYDAFDASAQSEGRHL